MTFHPVDIEADAAARKAITGTITGRVYLVRDEGRDCGYVYRSRVQWERRPHATARYVTARGYTPCWRSTVDSRTFVTRKEAAAASAREVLDPGYGWR